MRWSLWSRAAATAVPTPKPKNAQKTYATHDTAKGVRMTFTSWLNAFNSSAVDQHMSRGAQSDVANEREEGNEQRTEKTRKRTKGPRESVLEKYMKYIVKSQSSSITTEKARSKIESRRRWEEKTWRNLEEDFTQRQVDETIRKAKVLPAQRWKPQQYRENNYKSKERRGLLSTRLPRRLVRVEKRVY